MYPLRCAQLAKLVWTVPGFATLQPVSVGSKRFRRIARQVCPKSSIELIPPPAPVEEEELARGSQVGEEVPQQPPIEEVSQET